LDYECINMNPYDLSQPFLSTFVADSAGSQRLALLFIIVYVPERSFMYVSVTVSC
jgi:hypothetical protein